MRAGLLRFERDQRILEATGDVWVTRNLPAADGNPARTARTGADRLRYVEATRTLTLEGAAKYQEEPGLRLEAESIATVLSPNNEVESLVALGGVRLDSRGAKGTADRLEWTGGSRGSALLLGIQQFATLQSPDAPPLRGQRLRYDLATSQFAAEGGGGKTVIEEVPATGSAEKRP